MVNFIILPWESAVNIGNRILRLYAKLLSKNSNMTTRSVIFFHIKISIFSGYWNIFVTIHHLKSYDADCSTIFFPSIFEDKRFIFFWARIPAINTAIIKFSSSDEFSTNLIISDLQHSFSILTSSTHFLINYILTLSKYIVNTLFLTLYILFVMLYLRWW